MAILRNMASMTSATTGTGTLTLGTAVAGFITFANAGVPTGSSVTYLIVDGTAREVGRGVYTLSGLTLTRVTVLASTNGGAKISCSGAQTVLIVDAAEDHLWLDEAQVPAFTAAQKAQGFSNLGGAPYGGQLTPPVLTEFTQFGSDATFTQNSNANSVSITAATTNGTISLKGMSITAPATPYRVQALIRHQMIYDVLPGANEGKNRNFLGFYDGTKLSLLAFDLNTVGQFGILEYNSVTSFNGFVSDATSLIGQVPDSLWLAVADDGTTVYFRYSYDGVNWVTQYSTAKSSGFLGSSGYSNVAIVIDTLYNSTALRSGTNLLSWNVVAAAP